MPKSLVISNGNLHSNFDENLQMRDFFYPHVGQENHSEYGEPHRVGLWVDGKFSWLKDNNWKFDIRYHQGSLVGYSSAKNEVLQVELLFEDFVYTTHDILFRKLKISNLAEHEREFRIYFHHDFYIYGDKKEDTAQYEPDLNAILHYRKQRYFLVNGFWEHSREGIFGFSTGKAKYGNREGTWRDAEDGELSRHPIEQGSVDSTVEFRQKIKPKYPRTLFVWVAAGKCYSDILRNNHRVVNLGPERIYDHTFGYWKEWAKKHNLDLKGVPKEIQKLFYQSLLIIRSQIDNRGAIIAATDSDIMKFNKDTYSYTWPRDGAFVCNALSRAGYFEPVKNYLLFCQKIITAEGYVFHKFTPDGMLGSSWHPKWKDGQKQLPIQEDESALLLVALWELYKNSKSIEFVQKVFNGMVLKIGRFLINYTDKETGLPLPSYDPWEEQRGIFSYTCSTVYAALKAAENLSHVTGHYEDETIFRQMAKKLQKNIIQQLYNEEKQCFAKKIYYENGEKKWDMTLDSSISFLWEMGVLKANDPKMVQTMEKIKSRLSVDTKIGGLARYEGDQYHRSSSGQYTERIQGNPWIITTLWLANWELEIAEKTSDLHSPKTILEWVATHTNSAKILPEQLDPFTGAPLSVSPLTWSHATFADTIMRYAEKSQKKF